MEEDSTERRRPSSRSRQRLVSGMVAMAALGGPFVHENAFKGEPRGSRGNSMKRIGKTDDGEDILQDRGGRKYVRNEKGTIRRLKKGLG